MAAKKNKKNAAMPAAPAFVPNLPAAAGPTLEAVEPVDIAGPKEVDGFLHFSELDLLRYELLQHKVANSLQAFGMKQLEAQKGRLEQERQNVLWNGELVSLQLIAKQQQAELKKFQDAIQARYKLDLSAVSYDINTGKITIHGAAIPIIQPA